jgi:hypothetical protein
MTKSDWESLELIKHELQKLRNQLVTEKANEGLVYRTNTCLEYLESVILNN